MARIPALSFWTLLAVPLAGRAQNQAGTPAVSFAFAHVTVIDMTGAPPQSDMTVVVTGNRIATLGPLFLVNGVTGVREMWGSLDLVASAHIRLAQHRLTEPRFVASGQILD